MRLYEDAFAAIRDANAEGMSVVGWKQDASRWTIYKATERSPDGVSPDLYCHKSGMLPIPTSEAGEKIMSELLERALKYQPA
jgi:hypothetical protein